MVTKIKICGLTRMQDIEYANKVLPDYIGFVFAESRRHIDIEAAAGLKAILDSRIEAVGVFVNESIDVISDICNRKIIDLVQLHGDESEEYISTLHQRINNPIIKAIRVKDINSITEYQAKDINSANAVDQLRCNFLLLDAYSEKEFGGTGKTFDWEIVKNLSKPFFLAGGIYAENARAAIEKAKPYCLDVSSGVETNGFKDKTKIKQLVSVVRGI